jgi:hypothetical protein
VKRKPHIIDGIADIRDAVDLVCHDCLGMTKASACKRSGCCLFAWCQRAATTLSPDLAWVLLAEARRRKCARDRARRAGR